MTPTDEALIARLGTGDPAALAELMARFGPSLMRFATHYLRSAADADEVLQDVFVRADRSIRRGVRPERLESWLFRIAINRCRSSRRRWWPFASGESAERALALAPSPAGNESIEWREELDLALAALTPPLREAFLLKHVEGMSYEEISDVTGAQVSALKMRVARACDQLRARLSEVRG